MGLVQYQYTAAPATPHLAAVPFHVPFFAPEAVEAARRGTAARAAGREAGRRRRSGARNIVPFVYQVRLADSEGSALCLRSWVWRGGWVSGLSSAFEARELAGGFDFFA